MLARSRVLKGPVYAATKLFQRNVVNITSHTNLQIVPQIIRKTPTKLLFQRGFAVGSTDGHQIPEEVLNLSNEKYHQVSNIFLEDLFDKLEDLSDQYPTKIPDIEYSQGVMTLQIDGVGTYVINKQPPNKQIWLSSPVSGPNRFDLYQGDWVSLRDGSKLVETLTQEINDAINQADHTITL